MRKEKDDGQQQEDEQAQEGIFKALLRFPRH